LTTDHAVLINLLREIQSGMIEDGTAIGMGLATAVNRIKDSKAKSKVIILLTDGVNNKGEIAPATAADIAKTFGIRVYTIGVGTQGMAPYPVQTPYGIQYQDMPVEIDEGILQKYCRQQAENISGQLTMTHLKKFTKKLTSLKNQKLM
jgi:Ca-activated chloride channel family protein